VEREFSGGREESDGKNGVAMLAQFFPEAVPVRIPVRVTKINSFTAASPEHTVIEFGTPGEVLFASALPLDFEDMVRVKNSDGSLDVEAEIVAIRLHHGKTAVAARFLEDVTNWIIKKI
jgi:hypothetical protein